MNFSSFSGKLAAWVSLLFISMFTVTGVFAVDSAELPIYGKLGGDFKLTAVYSNSANKDAELVSLSEFKSKAVLVAFGFTHCPDVCPVILARYTQLLKKLDKNRDDISAIFISVDPERDTTEVLSGYLESFDSQIVGMTGDKNALARVQKQFATASSKNGVTGNFDHTDRIYLLDENLQVRGFSKPGEPISELVELIYKLF